MYIYTSCRNCIRWIIN